MGDDSPVAQITRDFGNKLTIWALVKYDPATALLADMMGLLDPLIACIDVATGAEVTKTDEDATKCRAVALEDASGRCDITKAFVNPEDTMETIMAGGYWVKSNIWPHHRTPMKLLAERISQLKLDCAGLKEFLEAPEF